MPSVNPGPASTSTANSNLMLDAFDTPSTLALIPASNGNQIQINAAISILAASGGGILYLGAGLYILTGPIVPASGVQIVGVAPQLNFTNAAIPDANTVIANGGGTVLQGDGTFAAFQWNKAVLGVPASANAFTLTALNGIGIKNLCLNNFSRAIDGGNTNNGGCWWSEFENLYITNCTDWGFWLTNFMHCKFRRIFTFACTNGQQFYGNDVPAATLQPGNSVWEDLYANTPVTNTNLARGIVFFVTQGQQNEGFLSRIQANRNNATVTTQAATMVNASANIAITDGTKFAVGMPVAFSASVNGFTAGQIYFVLSNAANVITVANTFGGAPINATGNTAVNCITQGWPALEIIALAGAAVSSHAYINIDVENGGTAAMVLQNLQSSNVHISQVPGSGITQSICARQVTFTQIFSQAAAGTDFDANCGSTQFFGSRAAGSVQRNPVGFYLDQGTNQYFFNLSTSVLGLTESTAADGSHIIQPQTGFGARLSQFASASNSLQVQNSGICAVTFTSGVSSFTLPTITSNFNGALFFVCNPTANNCTLTAAAGQFFNNNGALLNLVLSPRSGCIIAPVRDANSFYWAVFGTAGSYSAGTITGF